MTTEQTKSFYTWIEQDKYDFTWTFCNVPWCFPGDLESERLFQIDACLFLFLLIISFSLHGNQGTEIGGEISALLGFILSYSHYVSVL